MDKRYTKQSDMKDKLSTAGAGFKGIRSGTEKNEHGSTTTVDAKNHGAIIGVDRAKQDGATMKTARYPLEGKQTPHQQAGIIGRDDRRTTGHVSDFTDRYPKSRMTPAGKLHNSGGSAKYYDRTERAGVIATSRYGNKAQTPSKGKND